MRVLLPVALSLVAAIAAAGCATPSAPVGPDVGGVSRGVSAGSTLGPEVFPFRGSSSSFVMTRGDTVQIHVRETSDTDHVVMVFSPPSGSLRPGVTGPEMDVYRTPEGLVFANGPSTQVELVRFGIAPGEEWVSGTERLRFDGWERISVPGGTFDAARIRWFKGTEDLQLIETWWLAPDVGLVRMESDHGGVFVETLDRASR